MSDSVRGTLSWVNSGPVRSKCQENTTSAGDEHESVCNRRGRGGRRWGGFREWCPSDICQRGGRRQRQAVCDRLSGPRGKEACGGRDALVLGPGHALSPSGGGPGHVTWARSRGQIWRWKTGGNCQLCSRVPSTLGGGIAPTSSRVSGGRLSPLLWAAPPEGTLRRRGSVRPRALALGRILGLTAPPPLSLISTPPPSRPLCSLRGCIRFLGSKAPEPGHPREQKSPRAVEAESPIPTRRLVSLHSSTYCLCVFLLQTLLVPYVWLQVFQEADFRTEPGVHGSFLGLP